MDKSVTLTSIVFDWLSVKDDSTLESTDNTTYGRAKAPTFKVAVVSLIALKATATY